MNDSPSKPAPPPDPSPAPVPPAAAPVWPVALLGGLLLAQLGLAWVHGRQLNRQHVELIQMREDLQGLAEAIEQSFADPGIEDGSLAPARHHRPRPQCRVRTVAYRIQEAQEPERPEGQEQDRAAKELEAVRQSQEKAVKDAKVAQKKLSIQDAAQRAERAEKIDNASKNFMWASLGAAVLLFAAFAARGFIRRQRG